MKAHTDDPPWCGQRAARWKPAYHERYCVILGNDTIQSFQWNRTPFDHQAWSVGNCFRLRSEAEQARNQIKESC
jgi:hypothetical protein